MKKLISILLVSMLPAAQLLADGLRTYSVTITNATAHHVITPPLLLTHHRNYQLFNVATPASDGLVTLAETGNNQPLYAELNGAQGVQDVVATSDFIPYGQSVSFQITGRNNSRLSLVGMLATSNDAYAGLSAVSLPKKEASYAVYAYDAGSEENNEACAYIPGPPCAPGSGNARAETGAEGFITVHNGIHGHGDLDPAHLDWRGAVAIVTIKRMH